jgi:nucleotide-binding universal stress UspA family protein
MGLKDIVVILEAGTAGERRLAAAVALAAAHGAHLIGLSIIEPLDLSGYFSPAVSGYIAVDAMQALEERHREAATAAAKREEATFRDVCGRAGISYEWRLLEGEAGDMATLNARYADLVVAGQVDPENLPAGGFARLPEELALASGRPVLFVPYAGRFDSIGKRVLVAWNRMRESTRAVNDAIPLLARAEKVTVLSINPQRGEDAGELPGADISLHLARHGVKAEASYTVAEDIDVGSVLLSRAADLGADLIVMGCYGHSRTRELILGGATREVLRHMTVPVLMSH